MKNLEFANRKEGQLSLRACVYITLLYPVLFYFILICYGIIWLVFNIVAGSILNVYVWYFFNLILDAIGYFYKGTHVFYVMGIFVLCVVALWMTRSWRKSLIPLILFVPLIIYGSIILYQQGETPQNEIINAPLNN